MADSIVITDGTTSIDLYYDTDGFEMLMDGNDFGIAEHDNLFHVSDYMDGEMLIRHRKENREWPMSLAVRGDTHDEVTSLIAGFNRIVAQARSYEINGFEPKVYMQIQLDGAENWTRYDVVDVEYSNVAFLNWYNIRSKELVFDDGFKISVVTKPIGYGERGTLKNEIGTAHFEEDGNSDGLADKWNESGTPTTTLSSSAYIAGSQSQKVVTDSSGTDGIYSDAISCSDYQSMDFIAYTWVYRDGDTDDVTLDIIGDSSGSLGTSAYDDATTTSLGLDGSNTFYKLEVSGAVGASDTTITVRVERLTGDASQATTYYVDKCYLQFDTSTSQSVWMSSSLIQNHKDTTTEAVPYIDVTGIQGDIDASLALKLDLPAGNTNRPTFVYLSRYSRDPFALEYWDDKGGTVDATRTGGEYREDVILDSNWLGLTTVVGDLSNIAPAYGSFVMLVALSAGGAFETKMRPVLRTSPPFSQTIIGEESIISITSDWQLFATNPIYVERINEYHGDNILWYPDVQFQLTDTSTQTIYSDFVMRMPVDERYGILSVRLSPVRPEYLYVPEDDTVSPTSHRPSIGYFDGTLRYLGARMSAKPNAQNKFFVMFCGSNISDTSKDHDLDDMDIEITYTPRTEFLL